MSESPATLQAIFDRVVQMQAEQGQFRESVFDRIAHLQAQVGQVQAEQGQFRESVFDRIAHLQAQVGQMQAELGQVHTEQDQLRHELAQLDARVTRNHAEVLGHIERLDRKLGVMAENRIVDFATAERAEKIAMDTQRQTSAAARRRRHLRGTGPCRTPISSTCASTPPTRSARGRSKPTDRVLARDAAGVRGTAVHRARRRGGGADRHAQPEVGGAHGPPGHVVRRVCYPNMKSQKARERERK